MNEAYEACGGILRWNMVGKFMQTRINIWSILGKILSAATTLKTAVYPVSHIA